MRGANSATCCPNAVAGDGRGGPVTERSGNRLVFEAAGDPNQRLAGERAGHSEDVKLADRERA
ncbi:hypothetical protein [Haladaptatus salinisoli]|uniref:hypothetical protein n=1 Tax=Haladaptatus salinisoli TaxID=2884876 RepID=UPI001D09BFEA|nr:hypothetical protein [Haladaptatus salinisoli]